MNLYNKTMRESHTGIKFEGQILVNVSWTTAPDYFDGVTGKYKVMKDVYEAASNYTQGVIQDYPFKFLANPTDQNGKSLPTTNNASFTISAITGPTAKSIFRYLRIKPIMKGDETQTELSVRGGTGFLNQVKKLTGEGFSSITTRSGTSNDTGSDSPTVILETKLPLTASPSSALDYVLRSQTEVKKQTGSS